MVFPLGIGKTIIKKLFLVNRNNRSFRQTYMYMYAKKKHPKNQFKQTKNQIYTNKKTNRADLSANIFVRSFKCTHVHV